MQIVANKSTKILNTAKNKFDMVICGQMGKTSRKAKPPTGWFKVTTPKTTNQQSSGYKYKESYHYPGLSRNTNLQLNPFSNTQLDLIL